MMRRRMDEIRRANHSKNETKMSRGQPMIIYLIDIQIFRERYEYARPQETNTKKRHSIRWLVYIIVIIIVALFGLQKTWIWCVREFLLINCDLRETRARKSSGKVLGGNSRGQISSRNNNKNAAFSPRELIKDLNSFLLLTRYIYMYLNLFCF